MELESLLGLNQVLSLLPGTEKNIKQACKEGSEGEERGGEGGNIKIHLILSR